MEAQWGIPFFFARIEACETSEKVVYWSEKMIPQEGVYIWKKSDWASWAPGGSCIA